ncbi:hypothetical protein COOONC_12078 [Cooperia oncophora]
MLTLLNGSCKSLFIASIEDETHLLKFEAGLEIIVLISVFILKILSVTYSKNTLRIACLLVMVVYLIISCVAFGICYVVDYEISKGTQVGGIFGAFMDIVAYLLYLRIKQVKTE